jgi:hypothetical protein
VLRYKRNYKLIFSGEGVSVTVVPPLKIVFEATKAIDGRALNNMNIQVFNLTQKHQNMLKKDPEENKLINVVLQVGYQGTLSTIYVGTVFRGFLVKQGNNYVNSLQVMSGGQGWIYGQVSKTVQTKLEAIKSIVSTMPDVDMGQITPQAETIRPIVMVGNAGKLLQENIDPNLDWFIDDGVLTVMRNNQYSDGVVPLITSETGLKGTPSQENKVVTFETTLNPAILPGKLCKLQTQTDSTLSGIYRVQQIVTRGDSEGQDWYQAVTCQLAQGYTKL